MTGVKALILKADNIELGKDTKMDTCLEPQNAYTKLSYLGFDSLTGRIIGVYGQL